jgi:hypothetical protein
MLASHDQISAMNFTRIFTQSSMFKVLRRLLKSQLEVGSKVSAGSFINTPLFIVYVFRLREMISLSPPLVKVANTIANTSHSTYQVLPYLSHSFVVRSSQAGCSPAQLHRDALNVIVAL